MFVVKNLHLLKNLCDSIDIELVILTFFISQSLLFFREIMMSINKGNMINEIFVLKTPLFKHFKYFSVHIVKPMLITFQNNNHQIYVIIFFKE